MRSKIQINKYGSCECLQRVGHFQAQLELQHETTEVLLRMNNCKYDYIHGRN